VFPIYFKPLLQEVSLLSSHVDPVQLLAFSGLLGRERENKLDYDFFLLLKDL